MIKNLLAISLTLISASAWGSQPLALLAGSGPQTPKQPQACVDPRGGVHVTFGVGEDVYYCNIEGDDQPVPTVAFRVPNMSLGMRRGPRIAHTGDAIVITAIGGPQGKGRDGDVLAYRSLNAGKSWVGPVSVNDTEASAREGLHAMAASDDGSLWCVWLDLRAKGTQLFASKSTDQGATWGKNQLVYRSPGGSICECCHPSIIAGHGEVHVLFRNSLEGNRDMYLVSSLDRGVTFGPAIRLGEDKWQLNACPMDGGMLAMDNNQQLATVWRRDRTVFAAGVKRGVESVLGPGEQPWMASDGAKFHHVWTSKRDGDLMFANSDSIGSQRLGTNASFPVIVASHRSPSVVVLWEQRTGDTTSLMALKVR